MRPERATPAALPPDRSAEQRQNLGPYEQRDENSDGDFAGAVNAALDVVADEQQ